MKYLFALIALGSVLFAKTPPLSFIALADEGWQIVVCKDLEYCRTIQTKQEPRTYDYDFENGNIVYIGSDKNVHLIVNDNESILLKSAKNAYTEPSFIDGGKKIMLVELVDGNSKKTKLISLNIKNRKQKILHSQYSTALDPYTNNNIDLYYANVSCVEGCNKIIQEIWHKNLVDREANQLTLLNALSHQPRANRNNSLIYFSSNKSGNYHIWQYDTHAHSTKQLTFGEVTDGFPSPDMHGVYFLRRIENRTDLMYLPVVGDMMRVPLKQNYTKIRNLKVKQ